MLEIVMFGIGFVSGMYILTQIENSIDKNIYKGICCLCEKPLDEEKTKDGEVYYKGGNNAEPIKKGQCCNHCNTTKVTPLRMIDWGGERGIQA
jgi:hypothetical protein|tara:strand:- start:2553 stop:2831 length:279 start_codon:yes stop_codon:yes gene_type:complete